MPEQPGSHHEDPFPVVLRGIPVLRGMNQCTPPVPASGPVRDEGLMIEAGRDHHLGSVDGTGSGGQPPVPVR